MWHSTYDQSITVLTWDRETGLSHCGTTTYCYEIHAVSHCGTTTWPCDPACCVKLWATTDSYQPMCFVTQWDSTYHQSIIVVTWDWETGLSHYGTTTYPYEHTCCVTQRDNHLTLWAYVLCQAVCHYRFLWAYVLCHTMGQQIPPIHHWCFMGLRDCAVTLRDNHLSLWAYMLCHTGAVSHLGTTNCFYKCSVTQWDN